MIKKYKRKRKIEDIMEQSIKEILDLYLNQEMNQMILSKPKQKDFKENQFAEKIKIRPILLKKEIKYQVERYYKNQVFHKNHTKEELLFELEDWIGNRFLQAELFSPSIKVIILISKKGKITINCKKNKEENKIQEKQLTHNRTKTYLIPEGSKIPFLKDLGIITEQGKVVTTKYDKYRQINRFLEIIEDVLPVFSNKKKLRIIDFGCGRSYLTFIMYYYLTEQKGFEVEITGLDLKEEVIQMCNELKIRYGYEGLNFLCGDIASYKGTDLIDMVVTLHACDTATDAALKKALDWKAHVILSVPCCQHELNQQIQNDMLHPILKYGLIKERMSALITDALRANLLELEGYKVQLLEFIDFEHTPKNILIRAIKQSVLPNKKLKQTHTKQLEQCLQELKVSPSLYRLIQQQHRNEGKDEVNL